MVAMVTDLPAGLQPRDGAQRQEAKARHGHGHTLSWHPVAKHPTRSRSETKLYIYIFLNLRLAILQLAVDAFYTSTVVSSK